MQDAIDEFLRAPRWAQIAVAVFALLVVGSVTGSLFAKLRFRGRFKAIAHALGAPLPKTMRWPVTFPITVDERAFEVRYNLMFTSRNSSYRGPQGHLLITATRLGGNRWPVHQVDISTMNKLLARMAGGVYATGDSEFDARFLVREDGMKVREGWLDAAVRRQVTHLYDGIPSDSLIAMHEGELRVILREPWTGMDGAAVRSLLERQRALAIALERTSSSRH